MKPYTDVELARLAKNGVKNLAVICPAFVADCLETIEEIGIRGKEVFLANGGRRFTLIPCLNEHPLWIKTLERMATDFIFPANTLDRIRPIRANEPHNESALAR